MTPSEGGPTREIARFVARVRYEDLPPSVVTRAKALMLDALGCAIGGTQLQLGRQIMQLFKGMGGRPEAQMIGEPAKLPLLHATYVNSFLTNVLDFDDTHENRSHPGAMVVAPACAVGEVLGATGKELLTACVVGYEVAIRVGESMLPTAERFRQVWGIAKHQVFGTAAAAAKLHGFDAEEVANTLGLAGANAPVPFSRKSGLPLAERPRSQIKNNFGWASMGAVLAPQLTRCGVLGNRTFLDGPRGFWVMGGSDRFDERVLVEGLGERYHLEEVALKPFACCRWTHTAVEAIAHLRAAHGVSAADVARVRVRTFAEVAGAFNLPAPRTIIDAQFALPYVIALELHDRSPAAGMDEKDIHDPRILATARQVELVEDPAMTAAFEDTGEMPAEVEVQTVDGRAYRRRVGVPKGDPARPLGTDEIERKARLLIEPVAGGAKAHAFIQRIRDLERHGAADLLPPLFDGDGAAPPVARGWPPGEPTPMGS